MHPQAMHNISGQQQRLLQGRVWDWHTLEGQALQPPFVPLRLSTAWRAPRCQVRLLGTERAHNQCTNC